MATVESFLKEWRDGSDYIVAHTSGSTGTPKEIHLLKSDMRASAMATNAFFGIGPKSVLGIALSADYIAGKMMAVRAEIAGCRLCAMNPSNRLLYHSRIDLMAIVPSQIASFVSHPEMAALTGALLIGGGAPSAADCRALVGLGYKVYISYGMTETCSHVALADGADDERIFKAMPGISFGTSDDGRLIVHCPNFSFGMLQTNDLVELLSPVSFRWRGRADGVINSGGIKLVPEELEALYAPFLPGIRFYVTSSPHPLWGEAVVLVLEGTPEVAAEVESCLRNAVADHRRLPKEFIAVERLPAASNGKIRRLRPSEL